MIISKIINMGFYPANFNKQKQEQRNSRSYISMSYPIQSDTVSFCATPKTAQKTMEVSWDTATIVHKIAKKYQTRIVRGMKDIYDDLVATTFEPNNPIAYISDRPKSIHSIQEKSGSRQWFSVDEILNYMEDLNGVKTVFRDPQKSTIDSALERLIPLIKSRIIRIHEIENKRPAAVKGLPEHQANVYDYASIPILQKLIRIQEDVLNGKNTIGKKYTVRHNLTDDFTSANYCAIHMIMEFLGKESRVFEWQIMGNDMAIGKDLDDLIFKILDGKSVDKKYTKITTILKPLAKTKAKYDELIASNDAYKNYTLKDIYNLTTDEEWKKELDTLIKFNDYRGKVLLFQRSKGAKPFSTKKMKERFLPLDTDIDPRLDFNNLYDLKEEADHKAKVAARKKTEI